MNLMFAFTFITSTTAWRQVRIPTAAVSEKGEKVAAALSSHPACTCAVRIPGRMPGACVLHASEFPSTSEFPTELSTHISAQLGRRESLG